MPKPPGAISVAKFSWFLASNTDWFTYQIHPSSPECTLHLSITLLGIHNTLWFLYQLFTIVKSFNQSLYFFQIFQPLIISESSLWLDPSLMHCDQTTYYSCFTTFLTISHHLLPLKFHHSYEFLNLPP